MKREKLAKPLMYLGALFALGAGVGISGVASAQMASTSTSQGQTPHSSRPMKHQVGHDGVITAINGSTISMQEEVNEGGAVYTVDASGATFAKDGVVAALTDFKIGDKIMVDGTVSGTSVVAKKVMAGHPVGKFTPGDHKMSPMGMGVIGKVASVDGTSLTVTGANGTTYTVDAANTKVVKISTGAAPASAQVSDVVVGDTIAVRGTVTGNSVAATDIFDGIPSFGGLRGPRGPHAAKPPSN